MILLHTVTFHSFKPPNPLLGFVLEKKLSESVKKNMRKKPPGATFIYFDFLVKVKSILELAVFYFILILPI